MRSLRLLFVLLAVASLAAGCGHGQRKVPASAIAVVGDRTITRADFAELMSQARASHARSGTPFPAVGTAAYADLRATAVRLLVERAVLEQKAPGLGVTISAEQVETARRRFVEDTFGGSEKRYRARLRVERMTDEQVRSALRAQLLSQETFKAVTADVRVNTETVKRYYEAHPDLYSSPRTRAVRHILVPTGALARRLYSRLRAGGDFAVLARRFSRDLRTRGGGGRLVLVEGQTAPGLDRVAFALPAGGLARPFDTRFGWELVQALSAVRPRRTVPFAEAREQIRKRLLAEARNRAFADWQAGADAEFVGKTTYADGFAPANGA